MANPHELSQAAHDRLVAELEQLRTHGRIEMADRIERAREHGDLKENAEYHAAKEEKAKMEARIAQIAGILEHAVIVDRSGADTAMAGSIVTLRYDDEDDDEAETYLIGSIEERHDEVDHVVSPGSPLGSQLIGRKVGDTVAYEAPNGEQRVVVLAIE
jgi:transcription elongation factor GreA